MPVATIVPSLKPSINASLVVCTFAVAVFAVASNRLIVAVPPLPPRLAVAPASTVITPSASGLKFAIIFTFFRFYVKVCSTFISFQLPGLFILRI